MGRGLFSSLGKSERSYDFSRSQKATNRDSVESIMETLKFLLESSGSDGSNTQGNLDT